MDDNEKVGQLYGFYRAKVVDNDDTEKFGRVLVWIPDVMSYLPDTAGLMARPANNPLGGRNEEDGADNNFMGSSYIPRNGSWIWIFFENGNINRPYYFGALDLENAKVLPEVQVGGTNDKWVILKSHDGRTITISDDPDDARVEITGKKRQMSEPPSGDIGSVYTIDGNQTTILLDEREGKEKILLRTHKGDFLHIDVDEQKLQAYFKDDIHIKSDNNVYITAKEEFHIKADLGKVNIGSNADDVNIKAGGKFNSQCGGDANINSGGNINEQASQNMNCLAGPEINHSAGEINDLCGDGGPASPAESPTAADPKGERKT
jgi:hypothetical protein